jgi:hypothetical protein
MEYYKNVMFIKIFSYQLNYYYSNIVLKILREVTSSNANGVKISSLEVLVLLLLLLLHRKISNTRNFVDHFIHRTDVKRKNRQTWKDSSKK